MQAESDSQTENTHRRKFRFSLAAFFLFFSFTAVSIPVWQFWYYEVRPLQQQPNVNKFKAGLKPGAALSFKKTEASFLKKLFLNEDQSKYITALKWENAGYFMTDKQAEDIACYSELESLWLEELCLSDKHCQTISQLKHLKKLRLPRLSFTVQGLEYFAANCPNLEVIEINGNSMIKWRDQLAFMDKGYDFVIKGVLSERVIHASSNDELALLSKLKENDLKELSTNSRFLVDNESLNGVLTSSPNLESLSIDCSRVLDHSTMELIRTNSILKKCDISIRSVASESFVAVVQMIIEVFAPESCGLTIDRRANLDSEYFGPNYRLVFELECPPEISELGIQSNNDEFREITFFVYELFDRSRFLEPGDISSVAPELLFTDGSKKRKEPFDKLTRLNITHAELMLNYAGRMPNLEVLGLAIDPEQEVPANIYQLRKLPNLKQLLINNRSRSGRTNRIPSDLLIDCECKKSLEVFCMRGGKFVAPDKIQYFSEFPSLRYFSVADVGQQDRNSFPNFK